MSHSVIKPLALAMSSDWAKTSPNSLKKKKRIKVHGALHCTLNEQAITNRTEHWVSFHIPLKLTLVAGKQKWLQENYITRELFSKTCFRHWVDFPSSFFFFGVFVSSEGSFKILHKLIVQKIKMYNYAINEYVNRKKTEENHPYCTQNLLSTFLTIFFLSICTCISLIEKNKNHTIHILYPVQHTSWHFFHTYIFLF